MQDVNRGDRPTKLRPAAERFPLPASDDDDVIPTNVDHHRIERTKVELDDPDPTLPPDPPDRMANGSLRNIKLVPGVQIDRYELGELLGQGTFGRVFAARDRKLGRPVALKILHAEHACNLEMRQRFLQEAHAAACIAHPGIVTVFDAGETDSGTAYIAMEMLAGESLHARVARAGRMTSAAAIEIGRQTAAALAAAHRAGVIHRDLKPENIFIVPDPAATTRERVKVLDFGLAKPTQTASVQTQAASMFGTPAFMSPEQCHAGGGIDHRSDIYSFGCILFQLVTGMPPFEGSLRDCIMGHQSVTPPRLSSLAADVDPALDALVAQMLAKAPSDRPQTMERIELALSAMTPEPVANVVVESAIEPGTWARWPRLLATVLAAALSMSWF